MNPRSLEEDLLSIAGVEGAEVEGTSDKPAGLRIRIAEGADQAAVGTGRHGTGQGVPSGANGSVPEQAAGRGVRDTARHEDYRYTDEAYW